MCFVNEFHGVSFLHISLEGPDSKTSIKPTNYTNYTNSSGLILALSRRVIGCALEVHNKLGCGFLESVYGNALAREFTIQRIRFGSQVPFSVMYKGMPIGKYVADLVVEDKLLLELKATDSLTSVHVSQLLNYLNASGIQVGLLINFGARSLQVRRLLNGFGPDSLI